jgi:hypothetical protein
MRVEFEHMLLKTVEDALNGWLLRWAMVRTSIYATCIHYCSCPQTVQFALLLMIYLATLPQHDSAIRL